MAFRQVNTLKSRYFTFTEADMHSFSYERRTF